MDDQKQPNDSLYEQLVWNMRWLAAEPELAVAAEPRVGPDEIALSLNDILSAWTGLLGPWTELEGIDSAAADLVLDIDRVFGEISGSEHADLWSPDAVRHSSVWAQQRERARAVLHALGEDQDDAGLPGHV